MIILMNGQMPGPASPDGRNALQEAGLAAVRLRAVPGLADLLAEAFDAFEVIRLCARATEQETPGLLPVLMMAADAAVDGREAITIAPSLPPGPGRLAAVRISPAGTSIGEVTQALTRLAVLLGGRLASAATSASLTGDRACCLVAAQAAQRIGQLLTPDGHDASLR